MFGMGTGVTLLLWPPGNLFATRLRALAELGVWGSSREPLMRLPRKIVPEHFKDLVRHSSRRSDGG